MLSVLMWLRELWPWEWPAWQWNKHGEESPAKGITERWSQNDQSHPPWCLPDSWAPVRRQSAHWFKVTNVLGCDLRLRASWSTHSSGLSSWALPSRSRSHPVNLGRRHTLPVGSYCQAVSRLCVDMVVCFTRLSGGKWPLVTMLTVSPRPGTVLGMYLLHSEQVGPVGLVGRLERHEQTPDDLVSRGFSSAFSFPLTQCPIKILMWVEPHVFVGSALQYIINTFTLSNLPDHWLTCSLLLSHGTRLKSHTRLWSVFLNQIHFCPHPSHFPTRL